MIWRQRLWPYTRSSPPTNNMKQGLLIFIGFCLGVGFIIAGVGFGFISFVTDRNIPPATSTHTISNSHVELPLNLLNEMSSGILGAWNFVDDDIDLISTSSQEMMVYTASSGWVYYGFPTSTNTESMKIVNSHCGSPTGICEFPTPQVAPTTKQKCYSYDGQSACIPVHQMPCNQIFPDGIIEVNTPDVDGKCWAIQGETVYPAAPTSTCIEAKSSYDNCQIYP